MIRHDTWFSGDRHSALADLTQIRGEQGQPMRRVSQQVAFEQHVGHVGRAVRRQAGPFEQRGAEPAQIINRKTWYRRARHGHKAAAIKNMRPHQREDKVALPPMLTNNAGMSGRSRLISRRRFLHALGSTVAIAGLGGCARTSRAFRFLVVNDLHHATTECDPFFAGLVEQMRGHGRVEFCLIVGDLTDKGRPESFVAIRDAFGKLGAPVYTVPGNHDCDVEQTTAIYDRHFPGRLNYQFTHKGWQFIGLDSTDGNNWGGSHIKAETFAWLDAGLPKLNRATPTVLFTHFPLVTDVNPKLTPLNAAELLGRFERWNLRTAFSGHFHARTERQIGEAAVLTNACCARVRDNHDGTIPEGYLLCTAHSGGMLEREFVRYLPAEKSMPPDA
jgi:hypothetical protein